MIARHYIQASLESLKRLLRAAVEQAELATGTTLGADPFRGLAVESDDARSILQPARTAPVSDELSEWPAEAAKLALYQSLKKSYPSLSPVDFGFLLLAIAPEIDDGYGRVFGFLQDDVTRRRASVELAMALFDPTGEANVATAFGDTGTLIFHRLVELAEPTDGRTGWSAKLLRLDEQFARWVFGVASLDRRLAPFAEVVYPSGEGNFPATSPLQAVIDRLSAIKPFRIFLHGPDSRLHLRLLELIARRGNRRLLVVDLTRMAGAGRATAELVGILVRESRWFHQLIAFTGIDSIHTPEQLRFWDQFAAALHKHPNTAFALLGGRPMLPPMSYPLGVMAVDVPPPDADERFELWSELLEAGGISLRLADRELLAERYSLTRTQIELSVSEGMARARQRAAILQCVCEVTFEDLAVSARGQGGHDLESLTSKITPKAGLNDVVVPADVRDQLKEITSRVLNRNWVLREWGFARRQSYGLGVNALFAGPPGTGKTMAAEAIAHALGKDLFKIDLTSVVSKYIGETEQKLEQVFRAGEATQAVLFFDEADSLLGKRSEVKDAHDRYANLEVSYLLQRMERYDGLIVLATNLLGNLDEAFLRRMAAIVHFPLPTAAERRILWRKAWPTNSSDRILVPLADTPGLAIDPDFLADRFELTGGNIRNAVIAAAFSAADRPWFRFVTMFDVLRGVRREFQKLGQTMTDKELGLNRFDPPPPRPSSSEPDDQPWPEPSGKALEATVGGGR